MFLLRSNQGSQFLPTPGFFHPFGYQAPSIRPRQDLGLPSQISSPSSSQMTRPSRNTSRRVKDITPDT